MAELFIKINPVLLIDKTDMSECRGCKDKIYGKMYRLWLMPKTKNKNLIGEKTDLVFCESCYNVLEF